MRCIFPCLQLIYFYMGVEYITSFFLCFGKSRLEMLVLHCICPAETDRDRQTEHKQRQKDLVYNRTRDSLSEREGSSCLKNRSSGFFCKSVLLLCIFCYPILKTPFYLCTSQLVIITRQIPLDCNHGSKMI